MVFYVTPVTRIRNTVPLAVFVVPSTATFIVTPPIPRTNGILTVTLAPAAIEGIVPSACLPIIINPPSRSIDHVTPDASPPPVR